MNTKKYIFLIAVLAVAGSFMLAVTAFAQGGQRGEGRMMNLNGSPEVVGAVSVISGNTITVVSKNDSNTTTTFTVDATSAKVIKNGVASTISSIIVGDNVVVQGTVTGTNVVATTIRDGKNQGEMDFEKMMPNVVGKVSVIRGNTITVVSNKMHNTSTTTTFTVDATNAKLLRGGATITISDIAVGDNVVVQGTVTGTNVVATVIRDGKVGNGNEGDNNQALLQIQGNGQPIVAGTISAISGSTITITNSSNVTYTIDAANAKIIQGKNTISFSGMKTGDSVIVQGTVNGTSVVASTIIDQAKSQGTTGNPKPRMGFFGSIGKFFAHLFGF